MYIIVSENLGGSRDTFDNWRVLSKTIEAAQNYAEKDFGKKFNWIKQNDTNWRSEDLDHVMYHIQKVSFIDCRIKLE